MSKKEVIKHIFYVFLLVALFVLENTRGTAIIVYGAKLSALPFFLAALALFEGPYTGGIYGFAAGILMSIHSPFIEGLSAMYFGLFGALFGYLGAMYIRRVLPAALLGGSVCIAAHGLIRYFFNFRLVHDMGLSQGLLQIVVELGLSVVPGVLVFYIVRAIFRRFSGGEA